MSEDILNKILEEIQSLKEGQTNLQSQLTEMKTSFQSQLTETKDNLQSQLTEAKDNLQSQINELKNTQMQFAEKQDLMQIQLQETNQIVRAIRDRQDETDAKLDALSIDVHKLYGEDIAIKETQQKLIQGQERQDKILASLALHSLEQETDIRDLKRIK